MSTIKAYCDVAVITACYNCQSYLRETVESVAHQTILPKEHLIIDDCSTDNSLMIARILEREYFHVRVIAHDRNKGYPAALNTGIAATNCEFVGILDSDDIALPHWLETVLPVIEANSNVGAVGGGCVIMTDKGKITGCVKYCQKKGDVTSGIQKGEYLILHAGTVFRRNRLLAIGGYNSRLKSLEDNDVFLGISFISKLINVGIPLIYYRRLRFSESRKTPEFTKLKTDFLSEKIQLLERGYVVSEVNKLLEAHINIMENTPRLVGFKFGKYEFEIAQFLECGGHKNQAIIRYLYSFFLLYHPLKSLRGIKRCLYET